MVALYHRIFLHASSLYPYAQTRPWQRQCFLRRAIHCNAKGRRIGSKQARQPKAVMHMYPTYKGNYHELEQIEPDQQIVVGQASRYHAKR